MKYTILGFQQDKALKLGLKTDDLLLLRTIKDMYSSAGMEFITENNKTFMWVNQKYLLKQIPIIGSRRKMLNMLNKYVELDLIEKILKHSRNGQKGNYSYIRPTTNLDKLQDYDLMQDLHKGYAETAQGLCKNNTRVMQNLHNKDSSIIDSSIIDTFSSNSKSEKEKDFREITNLFEQNGFGTISLYVAQTLTSLEEEYGYNWLKEAMEIAVKANARNLRYVEGILKKWKAKGKGVQSYAGKRDTQDSQEVIEEEPEQTEEEKRMWEERYKRLKELEKDFEY